MKKQILALSCAIALGAGAVFTPTTGHGVEPTSRVGYLIFQSGGGAAQAAGGGGGGAAGGAIGKHLGKAAVSMRAIRGVSARMVMVRSAVVGARIGMIGGFVGLAVGGAVGAL